MKIIKTRNYKVPVYIDDDDYEKLKGYNWFIGKDGYIVRNVKRDDGRWTRRSMHREILAAPKGFDTEHADRNRTNNQKSNLRIATRSQNMANVHRVKKDTARSQYKGVSYLNRPKLRKKWLAYIKVDYKMYYLGYYETELEAAHVYNQFAEQVYGDFSYLNDLN